MNTVSSELKDYSIISSSENAGTSLPKTNQLHEYENNGYEHTSLRQHCTNREASSANVKQSTPNASYPQESFFHTAPINNSSSSFSVAENVLNIQKPDFFQENTFKDMQQPAPRIWQLPEDLQIKENLPKEIMWMEAYNEKCRECQRLRFDLEEEQSKVQLLKIDFKKQSQSEALMVSEKCSNESKQQIKLLQVENIDLREKYKQMKEKLDLQHKSFEKQVEGYENYIRSASQEKEKLEERFQIKETHLIATIKQFEEGQNSQKTKSAENFQHLQSRLAELEDQLRREKEVNILQLQKAMEYQRVSGLPMENCIIPPSYEQSTTMESTTTSDYTKTASSEVIATLLHHMTAVNVDLLEIKRRAEMQNKFIVDLLKHPDLKTILTKVPNLSTDAALNEMNTFTSNISGKFSTLSTIDNRQILNEQSISSVDSISIVPSVIRKIHNSANKGAKCEEGIQQTTSHLEINFENSEVADEAFGNLRKQAETIQELQNPDLQNKSLTSDVQAVQTSTRRKKFVKLNLKSNQQKNQSNRSGQIIAQPSDGDQQVYSPTVGSSGSHLHAKWPKTQQTQIKETSSVESLGRSKCLDINQNSFSQNSSTNQSDLIMECPVCPHKFFPNDTEQERSRHVNSHYDSEEDYDVLNSDAERNFDNINQNF